MIEAKNYFLCSDKKLGTSDYVECESVYKQSCFIPSELLLVMPIISVWRWTLQSCMFYYSLPNYVNEHHVILHLVGGTLGKIAR